MKEALVSPDLAVEIVDSFIPTPGHGEVIIKVKYAGCNPKDWKYPMYSGTTANSGDDVAGEIVGVGDGVFEFRPGDRVAAMHEMRTRGGSFAEYAIAPAVTTFHLPEHVSFEEAATIPLAALTAAFALYHNLKLPLPWEGPSTKLPLLIYGGSSAIGTFAIKFALRSNIHPLIVVAGKSRDFVESLLEKSQGDAVIDYRDGPDAVVEGIQEALEASRSGPAYHAFDCICEQVSFRTLSRVLGPKGHITLVLPERDYTSIPPSIVTSLTYVGIAHTVPPDLSKLKGVRHIASGDGKDLAFVISRLIGRALQEKWFSGHPHEIVPGGLNAVSAALQNLKDGKANAVKYVFNPQDTV